MAQRTWGTWTPISRATSFATDHETHHTVGGLSFCPRDHFCRPARTDGVETKPQSCLGNDFSRLGYSTKNPYGICAVLAIYALPLHYLRYEHLFFVLSLLALNSAGAQIIYQHIYVNYYHRQVDSPSPRAGKAMAALSVALAIVLVFQLFILRTPARRTLRRSTARLTYSMLAYNTILQAFVRSGASPLLFLLFTTRN